MQTIKYAGGHKLSPYFIGLWAVILLLLCGIGRSQELFHKVSVADHFFTIKSVVSCPDGSAAVLASTHDTVFSTLVIKIDTSGGIIWTRRYSLARKSCYGMQMTAANDQGFVIAGTIDSGTYTETPFLISISATGDVRWSYSYNLGARATAHNVLYTSDSSLVMVGENRSTITPDTASFYGFILKTDLNGKPLWGRQLFAEHTSLQFDYIGFAFETEKNSYTLWGKIELNLEHTANPETLSVFNIASDGSLKNYRHYISMPDFINPSVAFRLSDGGFAIVGGGTNILTFDQSLQFRWGRHFFPFQSDDVTQFFETNQGNLIVYSGFPFSEGPTHISLFDRGGSIVNLIEMPDTMIMGNMIHHSKPFPHFSVVGVRDEQKTLAFDYYGVSEHLEGCGLYPILSVVSDFKIHDTSISCLNRALAVSIDTIKLLEDDFVIGPSELLCSTIIDKVPLSGHSSISLYPNPTRSLQAITVTLPAERLNGEYLILRNLTGKELYRTELTASGQQHYQLPTRGLASGMYIVELIDAATRQVVASEKVAVQ